MSLPMIGKAPGTHSAYYDSSVRAPCCRSHASRGRACWRQARDPDDVAKDKASDTANDIAGDNIGADHADHADNIGADHAGDNISADHADDNIGSDHDIDLAGDMCTAPDLGLSQRGSIPNSEVKLFS